MKIGMIGAFYRNFPFATEIAFAKGLEKCGHTVVTFDPSRPDDKLSNEIVDALIVFKNSGGFDELVVRSKIKGATTIVYQPDDSRAPGIEGMLKETRKYCDFAFTFDSVGAKKAIEIGYKNAKKLLVTADTDIYKPLNLKKERDFAFVGSLSNPVMHNSRRRMCQVLKDKGFNLDWYDGIWDPNQINCIYNTTRVVLNHATDVGQEFGTGWGYQCRHFEVGFSGATLLSNKVLDTEWLDPNCFEYFDSEEDLIKQCENIISGKALITNDYYEEMNAFHKPEHRAIEIVQSIEEFKDG